MDSPDFDDFGDVFPKFGEDAYDSDDDDECNYGAEELNGILELTRSENVEEKVKAWMNFREMLYGGLFDEFRHVKLLKDRLLEDLQVADTGTKQVVWEVFSHLCDTILGVLEDTDSEVICNVIKTLPHATISQGATIPRDDFMTLGTLCESNFAGFGSTFVELITTKVGKPALMGEVGSLFTRGRFSKAEFDSLVAENNSVVVFLIIASYAKTSQEALQSLELFNTVTGSKVIADHGELKGLIITRSITKAFIGLLPIQSNVGKYIGMWLSVDGRSETRDVGDLLTRRALNRGEDGMGQANSFAAVKKIAEDCYVTSDKNLQDMMEDMLSGVFQIVHRGDNFEATDAFHRMLYCRPWRGIKVKDTEEMCVRIMDVISTKKKEVRCELRNILQFLHRGLVRDGDHDTTLAAKVAEEANKKEE